MNRQGLAAYGFFGGVLAALLLAWFLPAPGARGGGLRPEISVSAGVFAIFLLQGLLLPAGALRRGVVSWRLHVFVHVFLFAIFPLIAFGFLFFLQAAGVTLEREVRFGLLFLAFLPTTISTCVVLTGHAGGNVPVSLFNAVLSNVLAVAIVPLGILWLAGHRADEQAMIPLISDIALLVALPLAAGRGLRPWIGNEAERYRGWLRKAMNLIILFMLYTAFAETVEAGYWTRETAPPALTAACLSVGFLAFVHGAAWKASGCLGFCRGDRIAVFYGASQKSLAMGIPMAHLIFAGTSEIGLILIPVMVYHAVQLLAGSYLADRFRSAG